LPGVDLDADIQPFDFSIVTVPEPATLALLAAGALAVFSRRRCGD